MMQLLESNVYRLQSTVLHPCRGKVETRHAGTTFDIRESYGVLDFMMTFSRAEIKQKRTVVRQEINTTFVVAKNCNALELM